MQHAQIDSRQPAPPPTRLSAMGPSLQGEDSEPALAVHTGFTQSDPLFDSSPLPAWLLDADGAVLGCNLRAREDMWRCSTGVALWSLLGDAEERDLMANALACCLSGFPVTSTPVSLLNEKGQSVAGELYLSGSECSPGEGAVIATFAPNRDDLPAAARARAAAGGSAAGGRGAPAGQERHEDLCTLVGAVSGFAQIIRATVEGTDALQARGLTGSVDDLVECASQLMGLSEEIFDVGARPPVVESASGHFALNDLVAHAVHEFQRSYAPLELRLHWHRHPDELVVAGGARRVGRVLKALLENAARFSARMATVEVSISAVDGHASVCVRDQGLALDPAAAGAPFKARSVPAPASGVLRDASGLALYFANRLAQDLGARLRCEPTGSRGAAFWLDLPLAAPATRVC